MIQNPIFLAQLVCILLLSDIGLSFPLHSGCDTFTSTHWEVEGFLWQRLLNGQDAVPLSSQGNHYGEPLSFPCSHATQEECLTLFLAHWQGPSSLGLLSGLLCRECLLSGFIYRVTSLVGTRAGASSSMGAASSEGTSAGAGWVFLGIAAPVCPSGDLS